MTSSGRLDYISKRLFNENICASPLDKGSLELIEQYMSYYKNSGDLCRRLSDIELNYIQISAEGDAACRSATHAKDELISLLRGLTDGWRNAGYLQDYRFSVSRDDTDSVRSSFSRIVEPIREHLASISSCLITISETAAQTRACAASFSEVYKEAKLAVYAAMLNRDVDCVLDCRATSLQAHASIRECETTSAHLLGIGRVCTRIAACVNGMLVDLSDSIKINGEETSVYHGISPMTANNIICNAITALEKLHITN